MAAETKDYYKTLAVKRKASADEVRKAYRRLARRFHPDVNPGDQTAEDRFKDVQEAYDVLSDPKKRKMYDQYGFYSPNAKYPEPGGPGGGPGDFGFSGFDFSDFAGGGRGARRGQGFPGAAGPGGAAGAGGGFGDLFSQFFRSGGEHGKQQAEVKAGEDLEYAVDISFWDAIRGTSVRLNVQRYENCAQCAGTGSTRSGAVVCPDCKGGGQVDQTVGAMRFNLTCPRCQGRGQLRNSCPSCAGEGRLSRTDSVEVRIPPGAQNGSRLRVPKKGNAGAQGGAPGDLYIITRVGPHAVFQRDGDDIRLKAPISIPEAVLGAKIEVPTIDGKALLKIPPATSSGKVFRLREKGVLNRRTNRRGDQYVEVQIAVPAIPSEDVKDLMRDFEKIDAEDPRAGLFEQV